ncbi:MAG: EF-P lysine aminoacylase EpmA [Pirellulaceae bacterium]
MTDVHLDFGPTACWDNLRRRAALLGQVRRFFDGHGFLEVDTPLLSRDTVVDQHLEPLPVRLIEDPRCPEQGTILWLQTSPEFCMKRLLSAGATAIYQVTRAFRGAERGPLHNPEFTMLEWYRVGDDMHAGMQLLDELTQALLDRGPAERLSYADAFLRALNIHPGRSSVAELADAAHQHGLQADASWPAEDRDAWLDWLLVTCVEPTLGRQRPTILYDYPASQAALAVVRPDAVPVAERFELYVDGIELANGYHELTDPIILENRTRRANQTRVAEGKYPLPETSRLLDAMRHGLPAATGVALGFDRLVMVAVGATNLAQVMAFPLERA